MHTHIMLLIGISLMTKFIVSFPILICCALLGGEILHINPFLDK